jgi:hydrogenase expression/formation protein HypC
MCLAIPGRIEAIDAAADDWTRTARVSFGSVSRVVNVSLVPEAAVGRYVLVHVGVAIQCIDEGEAQRCYALFDQLDEENVEDADGRAPA